MTRAALPFVLVLVLVAELGSVSAEETHQPGSANEISESRATVVGYLDDLDDTVASTQDAEFVMAWNDLYRDLTSLIEEEGPTQIEGARARVDGFISRFELHEAMDGTESRWDRLIEGLEDLRSRLDVQFSR